jgi:hypothetical protein
MAPLAQERKQRPKEMLQILGENLTLGRASSIFQRVKL